MTPAQKRIQASAALDRARNAQAIGGARERCIPDAVARLVPLLTEQPEPPGGWVPA